MTGADGDDRTADHGDVPMAEVERLPLPQRAEAYLTVQQRLQDRLGLGGP